MSQGKAFEKFVRHCEIKFDWNPNVWVKNTGNLEGTISRGALVVDGPALQVRTKDGAQPLSELIEGLDTIRLIRAPGPIFSYRITVTGRGPGLFKAPTLLRFKDGTGDVYSLRLFAGRYKVHHVDFRSAEPTIQEISFRFAAKQRSLSQVGGMKCLDNPFDYWSDTRTQVQFQTSHSAKV